MDLYDILLVNTHKITEALKGVKPADTDYLKLFIMVGDDNHPSILPVACSLYYRNGEWVAEQTQECVKIEDLPGVSDDQ